MNPLQPNPLPANLDAVTHICCIGVRRESLIFMCILSQHYPNKTLNVVDFNQARLEPWINGTIDWVEPGLEQSLITALQANLTISDNVGPCIGQSQMILIWVDIPTKQYGLPGLDTSEWERALRFVVQNSGDSKIIVERSSVPIDAFNITSTVLDQGAPNFVQFAVFSNPDFSCPGEMLDDMLFPDQVIIARKSQVGDPAILVQFYAVWVNANNIIVLPNYLSAEVAKLMTNVLVGLKITFMNLVASYCEEVGGERANFSHIKQIFGRDYRFEEAYTDSTLGIGGPEYMKDIMYCKGALQKVGLTSESRLLSNILSLDKKRRDHFIEFMLEKMMTLKRKLVAVIGLTYKRNIGDTTNSPSIKVCKLLLEERATIRIYDRLRNPAQIRACFRRNQPRVVASANVAQAYCCFPG